jgi:hypothetical protein
MADLANGILVTNIVPRSGPGKAGFCVKRADGRLYVTIKGVQKNITLSGDTVAQTTTPVVLTAAQSGRTTIFNSTTSMVSTLPKPAKGLTYTFIVKVIATSGIGHSIGLNGAAEKVWGQTFTIPGVALAATAGKGLTNTQATAVIGDNVTVTSDGTDWYARPIQGIWAQSA